MLRIKSLIVIIFCFAMVATARASGEAVKIARSEIWQDINTGKCGSATAAIMEDGKLVYAEGFGMADREQSIAVDKNTIFNMGSISKVYTAASIMLLVDDGKVSLDKPVTDYLPEFKMADPRYKKITVRMILSHTSGLPGSVMANSFGFKYNDRYLKDILGIFAREHLKADPGAMAPYCNDGFTLAEMIIERVSGEKFIDFLNQRIFTPLGLKNTGLSVGELKNKPVSAYYDPQTAKIQPLEVLSVLGAGGLSATAEDLCLFADAFSAENKLFKKSSLEEMKKPQPSALRSDPKNPGFPFGLGWDIAGLPRYDAAGILVLGKNGGTGNYSSMLFTVPGQRISVVVIASGPHSDAMKIALEMLDAVLVEKKLIPKEEKTVSIPVEPQKIPQDLASFGGYYAGDGGNLNLIVFDMEKNTVSVQSPNPEEKAPGLSLIYNNGHFYDKDGNQFSFASIDGNEYLIHRYSIFKLDVIMLQKAKLSEKPQCLKINMDGKLWLRRNVYPFEGVSFVGSHFVKSMMYKGLPGYVDFGGVKKIESPEFAGMPFGAIRDQSELTLFEKNAATWAWLSDMLFSPADGTSALKAGENSVKLAGDGYNQWLVADEGMVLSFTEPQNGRIIVFSPDATQTYDSAIDTGDTFVAQGSYVEFAGYPDDVFVAKAEASKISSVPLIRLPLTRQGTDHTCGVASLQSVLAYYGQSIREDNLGKEVKVTDEGTSWQNIKAYVLKQGFNVDARPNMTLDELKNLLAEGKPVMLAIQAWADKPLDYKNDWNDGHWVVAVGYDSDKIYFMDPSTLGNYTFIPIPEFLNRWHDTDIGGKVKLEHFGMCISKNKPVYKPDSIERLE